MASFVLIHGAMHGGWCWERLVPLLEAQGHFVTAPDLPGLGGSRVPAGEVTLENWGKFVAEILRNISGRTILVGHSLGGVAISQAAEYAPDHIAVSVYLAAVLQKTGLSASDLPQHTSRIAVVPSADGQYITATPQDAAAAFYGETAPVWRDRAVSLLVPQPTGIFQMPLQLSQARYGSVKRAYIHCLRDQALTIETQGAMQAASPCDFTAEIDTDHSPFYSEPDALAGILVDIAAKYI